MDKNLIYRKLPSSIRGLYDTSDPNTIAIAKVGNKYEFSSETYKNYVLTVGDVILGIYKVSDLPEKLQENVGVDEQTAKAITQDLLEFLSPVLEAEKTDPTRGTPAYIEKMQAQTTTPENEGVQEGEEGSRINVIIPERNPEPVQPPTLADEQNESEAPPETSPAVEPIRTMPEDIKKIHGYGAYRAEEEGSDGTYKSSQDDIQRPQLADRPRYEE